MFALCCTASSPSCLPLPSLPPVIGNLNLSAPFRLNPNLSGRRWNSTCSAISGLGYKRILPVEPVKAKVFRLSIDSSLAPPVLN